MHQLISSNNMTMTSREIAELVESRHDKVKQSIDRLVEKGVISQPPMGDGAKSANGTVEKIYVFSGEQGKLNITFQHYNTLWRHRHEHPDINKRIDSAPL